MKKVLLTTLVVALTGAILFTGAAYAGPGHPGRSPRPLHFPKPPVYSVRADITKAWIMDADPAGEWIHWAWQYSPGEPPTTVTVTDIQKDGVSILWTPVALGGWVTNHWFQVHPPVLGEPWDVYTITFDAAWGSGPSAYHETYCLASVW